MRRPCRPPGGHADHQVNIEDGDFFQVDRDANGVGDVGFEFDTGPEFLIYVNAFNAANPAVPQDGDVVYGGRC